MRVLVSGASGFIGSRLVAALGAAGHQVTRLVRREPAGPGEVRWDPERGILHPEAVEGVEAVVHLAGESIASGRWTPAVKERIRRSRVDGTRRLCESLTRLTRRPGVHLNASAVGFYGHRGAEVLREESSSGAGFLAEACREWEAATDPARQAGMRVVLLRIGAVLHPAGGMLGKLLPPFRLGVGGVVGPGTQYVSWIAMPDLLGTIQHALMSAPLAGPVNVVSPHPVTNREFTRTLGRVLRRPTICPLPALAARALLGEMADELLLASQRVEPARLLASGYHFQCPELEPALRGML